jgi:hypothetical protein
MKRTLVTDLLFPTRYSLWRICEIASFIKEKKSDVLVFKIDNFAGVSFDVDFEEMKEVYGYEGYNILIFDPKYNHLNRYNARIDGTQWNGKFPASYLFTTNTSFDVGEYELIYHVFLLCYYKFNELFECPQSKQAIHLYPGGGFSGAHTLHRDRLREVKLVSTNPKTKLILESAGLTNYLECPGGTFFFKEGIYPHKISAKHDGPLTIAFASLGHVAAKGAAIYQEIKKLFREKYPTLSVNFIAIGNYPFENDGVSIYPPMPMLELMKFYELQVDILVSIDTGIAFNGWPLGIEAALTDVLVATTDPNEARHQIDVPANSLAIFSPSNVAEIVELIKTMDEDRDELFQRGERGRKYFSDICSYANQQERIFSFLGV